MSEEEKKIAEEKLNRMGEDINDLRVNVGELKVNVGFIKDDISEMKGNVTSAVDKMSETLVVMATVTEKLNSNMEEHKTIHARMDGLANKQEIFSEELQRMKSVHKTCANRRQVIEDEKKKSVFQAAKKRFMEILFVALFFLMLFIAVSHIPEFMKYIKTIPFSFNL